MRLLIADDNASLRKQLKRYFETRGHQVETARDGVEAWHQLRRNEPDVVLCDAVMPHMTGHELARTVRRNPATEHVPVVLFSAQTDGSLVRGRDFADEILPKPLDLDILELRLVAILKRIADGREPVPQIQGQVTAVTSAKGGTGVSTIAANLALALAIDTDKSVVAVDLDLEYGDLPMLLDVPPKGGTDQLIRSLEVDGDSCAPEDFFARHEPSGLRILGAPRNPVDALQIDEGGVNHLMARLRSLHDHVVVDVPRGFADPALATLTAAQRVVVVVVPEVTALRRTLTLLEILRSLKIEEQRLLLVYNQTVASDQLSRERVEGFLGHRIPLEIAHDLELFHRATTTGRPVVLLDPGHRASRDLRRLAELVGILY
ncbi:MAG: two-component system, sensor histidine kinase and response regulator [Chloroflexota bacterium]|jgi:pilus assembly protein CpaE|nr:two-component system, sensor histidine kinase and response regulator [Chloroflexota bacterium]